jgi:hypothetical protein
MMVASPMTGSRRTFYGVLGITVVLELDKGETILQLCNQQ